MKRFKKLILPVLFAGLVSTSCTVKPFDWLDIGFCAFTVSGMGTGLFSWIKGKSAVNKYKKNNKELNYINSTDLKNIVEIESVAPSFSEKIETVWDENGDLIFGIPRQKELKKRQIESSKEKAVSLNKKNETYILEINKNKKYRNIGLGVAAVGVVGFIGRTIYNRYSRSLVEDGI